MLCPWAMRTRCSKSTCFPNNETCSFWSRISGYQDQTVSTSFPNECRQAQLLLLLRHRLLRQKCNFEQYIPWRLAPMTPSERHQAYLTFFDCVEDIGRL